MRFAETYYAYSICMVFILGIFLLWSSGNKKRLLKRFAEDESLKSIASSVNFKMQATKRVLILIVFIFGIIALMRPQWGFEWQEVKRKGLDILIAIDTSNSMLASDIKPNRLERSKMAVRDLIKKLKGDRIGLIAFSGTAFLQCPLTIDYGGFLLALNDLSRNTIPRGGTSISSAIDVAMNAFEGGEKGQKVMIVITDGEDHEGNPQAAAEKARKKGIKIFCIGIGTKEGELVQIPDKNGRKTFLKDRKGNAVKSRLNEDVLQKIAMITGGAYVRSSATDFGLEIIYEEKLSGLEKKEIKARMKKNYYERFQIALAVALFLLLLESFIRDVRKTA